MLYARKLQLQGRQNETALNVLATLDGVSWTQCEDLELSELEKAGGLDMLLARLDAQWSYDSRVEMPQAFENFFFKLRRKPQQTLLEYSAEFQQTLREITKHKVKIPDAVAGWMMLRRSGLSKDQEHLIQTQVGADLTSSNVERAMYLTLGQDYRGMQQPGHLRKGQPTPQRWKRSAIHNVWDEDADYEPNETAEDDLTYAQWNDFDEQDLEWNDDSYYESTYFAEMLEEYS